MTDMPATVSPSRLNGAVATRQPKPDMLQFSTIAEAMKFADLIQNAEGAIPKHCIGKPGKILATIMAGHELGIGPMASLRAFHVVEGKPTADYSFWVARLKAAGYRVEWPERSQERVTLKLTAPDGSTATDTWDKARAIVAGLWNGKDPWKKYPQTMLSARAVTSLGRAFAGEVMFGCYETDEADEIVHQADLAVRAANSATPLGDLVAAPQRAVIAAGGTVTDENVAIEAKAKECADMLKALGMQRADLFALLGELKIEHTEKTRISELPKDALDRLAERLDAEAELRRGGGEPKEPQP